jgi:hypothetical protein
VTILKPFNINSVPSHPGKCWVLFHGHLHYLEATDKKEFVNKSNTESKVSLSESNVTTHPPTTNTGSFQALAQSISISLGRHGDCMDHRCDYIS